jgi:hypothetical protein
LYMESSFICNKYLITQACFCMPFGKASCDFVHEA